MTIIDRLKLFMDHVGLSNSQFADKAGIPRPTLSQLLHGRNKSVNDQFLRKLNESFPELDIRWLLFGLGDMLTNSNIETSDGQNPRNSTQNTPQEFDFMDDSESEDEIISSLSESSNRNEPVFLAAPRPEETVNPRNSSPGDSARTIDQLSKAFGAIRRNSTTEHSAESPSQKSTLQAEQPKKISTIIVLYTDSSFETFLPAD